MKTLAGLVALAMLAAQVAQFSPSIDFAASAKASAQSRLASQMLADNMHRMQ